MKQAWLLGALCLLANGAANAQTTGYAQANAYGQPQLPYYFQPEKQVYSCQNLFDVDLQGRAHNIRTTCEDPALEQPSRQFIANTQWKVAVIEGRPVPQYGIGHELEFKFTSSYGSRELFRGQ